ncbi:MAG TPA: histidine phosphatase family protein [Rhizomicrobium sp.]
MALSLRSGLTLFFARHGETQANVAGRLQGQSRDAPLTAKGTAQAKAVGRILRAQAEGSFEWVSSPLPRARRTTEIAREACGLPPEGFRTDPRIIELNLGAWEGLTHAQARERDPAHYAARETDKWNVAVPGGENYAQVAARAQSWIGDLSGDTIAVTHGGFTRVLRGLFGGLAWQAISDLDEPQGVVFRVRGSTVERLDA